MGKIPLSLSLFIRKKNIINSSVYLCIKRILIIRGLICVYSTEILRNKNGHYFYVLRIPYTKDDRDNGLYSIV